MSTHTATPRVAAGPQLSGVTDRLPGVGARSSTKQTLLLALTSGLLAALVLNLVAFDDLRTDATATVAGTFLAPQHLTSILAGLLAVVLVARGHRWARRVALAVVRKALQMRGLPVTASRPIAVPILTVSAPILVEPPGRMPARRKPDVTLSS